MEEVVLEKEQVGFKCPVVHVVTLVSQMRSSRFPSLRQLVAQESQSRREITRLHEKMKQQTAEHLKAQGELSSTMKRRHEAELQAREEEGRVLSADVAHLRVKLVRGVFQRRESAS